MRLLSVAGLVSAVLALCLGPGLLAEEIPAEGLFIPKEVVEAIDAYRSGERAAEVKVGAERVIPFGLTVPVLEGAPLRFTYLMLEPGERTIQVAVGDSKRWHFWQMASGAGGARPGVAFRPNGCDQTTNAVITTDRRVYSFVLHAAPCAAVDLLTLNPHVPWDALVSFYYPRQAVTLGRHAAEILEERKVRSSRARMLGLDRGSLAFGFKWRRKSGFPWVPEAIFTAQGSTYLRVPASVSRDEMPLFFRMVEGGERELLHSSWQDDFLVVEDVVEAGLVVYPKEGRRKHRQPRLSFERKADPR